MPDCRIEWRACFLCIRVCLKGMFMLKVDIKFTINLCRICTKFSIENDLNLGFKGARPIFIYCGIDHALGTIFRTGIKNIIQ